jgi:hypothetical protein
MSEHTAITFPFLLLHPHLNPKHNPYFLLRDLVLHNNDQVLSESGPEFPSLPLPHPPPNRSAATIRRLVHSALDAQPRKRFHHQDYRPTRGVAANAPEGIDRTLEIRQWPGTVTHPYRGRHCCATIDFAERMKGMIGASVAKSEEYMHLSGLVSGSARMEAWILFL